MKNADFWYLSIDDVFTVLKFFFNKPIQENRQLYRVIENFKRCQYIYLLFQKTIAQAMIHLK